MNDKKIIKVQMIFKETPMKTIDLHVHSTKSDGSFTPSELVAHALKKGLSAFALTDHDTTVGIDEAIEAARGTGLEVIPGIEFSTEYEGKDIHVLGLYIDYKGKDFQKYLIEFQNSRDVRNQKMCVKLQEHGIPVIYEELTAHYPGAVLTRAHYANYMLEKGYIKDRTEAFERYIGDHAPCFLPREKVTPKQAVELILRSGGIPVLAHPVLYHMSDAKLEQLVASLKEAGLVGIEAIYSTYATAEERQMRYLASKYDLLITGGSDFHGTTKPNLDMATGYGKLFIPYEILEKIKDYRRINGKYNRRIIFADMDNTLLNSQKEVTPEIYDAIKAFSEQGGHFVLSSGRPLDSILETREKLGLDFPHTYIISFNGALIYDCDNAKPLLELTIPFDDVSYIFHAATAAKLHMQSYCDGNIISPADDEELSFYRRHIHMPALFAADLISGLKHEPYKMLSVNLTEPEDHRLAAFSKEINAWGTGRIHTFFSGDYYLECCRAQASKGNAVRFLCQYLGIPITNSIAAGDAANDISMLTAAGCGVCMCNGTEDTKEAADYITECDCDHNGFMEIFTNLL